MVQSFDRLRRGFAQDPFDGLGFPLGLMDAAGLLDGFIQKDFKAAGGVFVIKIGIGGRLQVGDRAFHFKGHGLDLTGVWVFDWHGLSQFLTALQGADQRPKLR